MTAKSPISRHLRIVASAIESLTDAEIAAIIAGRGKLVFFPIENQKERRPESMGDTNVDELLKRIDACKDREELRAVLLDIPNRDELANVARALKIHVVKGDRREEIENKVIEFVIGSKLRTDAIQTLNFKNSGHGPVNEQSTAGQ